MVLCARWLKQRVLVAGAGALTGNAQIGFVTQWLWAAIGTHPVGILCNGFRTLKRDNTVQVRSNPLTIKLQAR
jgi:hypothetical protein